jgi:hypothetical protein
MTKIHISLVNYLPEDGPRRPKPVVEVLNMYVCLLPVMSVPRHHGMARPQVADGGTASNMEGSCEYIE